MTQTNPPGEIKCPHCGQTYAISPEQWPQYQGRSIACTKCGQQFAVGGGGAPPVLPPMSGQAMPPGYAQPGQAGYAQPGDPPQGYGFPPPAKKGMSGGIIALIVIACLALPCVLVLLISILLPALNKVRQEALKAKCASNMKNIAAAMITYSNTNNGQYPDSMVTLVRGSGMNTAILVCPDSNDTPATVSSSAFTSADMSGHCSYVYAAAGLTSNAGSNDVLVYESGTDHHGRGMNVLYGDYHVAWLNAAQAKLMIQQLSTPRPPAPPVGAP